MMMQLETMRRIKEANWTTNTGETLPTKNCYENNFFPVRSYNIHYVTTHFELKKDNKENNTIAAPSRLAKN